MTRHHEAPPEDAKLSNLVVLEWSNLRTQGELREKFKGSTKEGKVEGALYVAAIIREVLPKIEPSPNSNTEAYLATLLDQAKQGSTDKFVIAANWMLIQHARVSGTAGAEGKEEEDMVSWGASEETIKQKAKGAYLNDVVLQMETKDEITEEDMKDQINIILLQLKIKVKDYSTSSLQFRNGDLE